MAGNRFKEGLSSIKDASGKTPGARASEPVAKIAESAQSKAPSRADKVVVSAYFDKAVRQQLAILSVRQDKSQAAMLAEALNLLFEKYGEPPIARG